MQLTVNLKTGSMFSVGSVAKPMGISIMIVRKGNVVILSTNIYLAVQNAVAGTCNVYIK